jgi:hypothetical protein
MKWLVGVVITIVLVLVTYSLYSYYADSSEPVEDEYDEQQSLEDWMAETAGLSLGNESLGLKNKRQYGRAERFAGRSDGYIRVGRGGRAKKCKRRHRRRGHCVKFENAGS